ncbi:hypothetical protein HK100_007316 [Physocladia obscura]|uniref:G-protein coupled receptors family 2 profile 2 domain-containing protein n=1 Tax=Physocladia obscura TaxID=109957 RepID=A0AAD5T5E2_9FUNG|nr:hypothetical protein HK100_007316 [Physocladia obscura]
MSLYVCIVIVQSKRIADNAWYYYHAYAWTFATLATSAIFITQVVEQNGPVIGDATYECWITNNYPTLRLGLLYGHLWFHCFGIGVLYFLMFRKLQNMRNQINSINKDSGCTNKSPSKPGLKASNASNGDVSKNTTNTKKSGTASATEFKTNSAVPKTMLSKKKLVLKASLVSFGFIAFWTPPTVMRILGSIPGTPTFLWLEYLTAVAASLTGLWNATSASTFGLRSDGGGMVNIGNRTEWYFYHAYAWLLSGVMTVGLFVAQSVGKKGPVIGDPTFECYIDESYSELRLELEMLQAEIGDLDEKDFCSNKANFLSGGGNTSGSGVGVGEKMVGDNNSDLLVHMKFPSPQYASLRTRSSLISQRAKQGLVNKRLSSKKLMQKASLVGI